MIDDVSTIRSKIKQWRIYIHKDENAALLEKNTALIRANILKFLYEDIFSDVLCYYPNGMEIDLLPLYNELIGRYNIYFPVTGENDIEFWQVNSLDKDMFSHGKMNIMEPRELKKKYVSTDDKTTVAIVPGLVFSKDVMGRIGYGAGYYDRFLAENADVKKIGACFEKQIFSGLPLNEWDVPMDVIITEQGIYNRNRYEEYE